MRIALAAVALHVNLGLAGADLEILRQYRHRAEQLRYDLEKPRDTEKTFRDA